MLDAIRNVNGTFRIIHTNNGKPIKNGNQYTGLPNDYIKMLASPNDRREPFFVVVLAGIESFSLISAVFVRFR